MQIEDCAKKQIFGSFDRNKLPNNLNDYTCQLYIEQYAQGPTSEEVKYFRFTPKYGVKADSFSIAIDNLSLSKNLIYFYRVDQKEPQKGSDAKVTIGDRMEVKMLTTVKQPPKKQSNVQLLSQPDSEGQLNLDELDEMMVGGNNLQLNDSVDDQDESNDSKCVQPPEGVKGNIKNEIIHYFHIEENRFSRNKDIKLYLKDRGHKISQNGLKSLLGEICRTNLPDKKVGFVLKEHFFQKDEYQRKNPKKKIKEQ